MKNLNIMYVVQSNPFIPTGFNQNTINDISTGNDKDGNPSYDLGAIIACVMSSNLYLNGLANADYLNMPQNLRKVEDWYN